MPLHKHLYKMDRQVYNLLFSDLIFRFFTKQVFPYFFALSKLPNSTIHYHVHSTLLCNIYYLMNFKTPTIITSHMTSEATSNYKSPFITQLPKGLENNFFASRIVDITRFPHYLSFFHQFKLICNYVHTFLPFCTSISPIAWN